MSATTARTKPGGPRQLELVVKHGTKQQYSVHVPSGALVLQVKKNLVAAGFPVPPPDRQILLFMGQLLPDEAVMADILFEQQVPAAA